MSELTDKRSDTTRELILRAAAHQFAQRPYYAVGLDDILAEAQLTKGAMYFHFRSKHALALAIVDEQSVKSDAGIKDVLTAEENLSWLSALHHPASREAIWQALAAVGLKGFEDVPCHTLSAGQQRRVALARLYLDGPPLWILDEPFTALDKQGVAQLEEHLAAHCEQGGMVVLTTHHTLTRMPAGYRDLDLGRWSV